MSLPSIDVPSAGPSARQRREGVVQRQVLGVDGVVGAAAGVVGIGAGGGVDLHELRAQTPAEQGLVDANVVIWYHK